MEKKFQAEMGMLKSAILFVIFLIYTDLVCVFDVKPIGPTGTKVGFAAVNQFFVKHIGVHAVFYTVTDLFALLTFLVILTFAVIGFIQLVKRKNFFRVDPGIIMMAVFYVLIAAFYFLFEKIVINYRPVLIDGVLEASYPSSHTMLVVAVIWAALIEAKSLLGNNKKALTAVTVIGAVIIAAAVIGRILAGVHWFSDIIGSLILSAFLVYFYCTLVKVYDIIICKKLKK